MPKLLKNNLLVANSCQTLAKEFAGPLPTGPVLIPLRYWVSHRDTLELQPHQGVWLDSDEDPDALADDIPRLACVGVNFQTFMDGRGFSLGRLLRERYGFRGELRALGHIIADQLFYLKRCGFDSFEVADDFDPAASPAFLDAFSVTYQAAADNPLPLFRRSLG